MQTKELILSGFANLKRNYDRTLATLTPEEMAWQPKPDANSIQIILFHIARAEDTNVQQRLQGKPTLWESEKWYQKLGKDIKDDGAHYKAEQLPKISFSNVKDLLAYTDAVRAKTLEYVNSLNETDFDRKFNMPAFGPPLPPGAPPRPPMEVTVGAMLLNTITHLFQHTGECSYIRGLKRGMDK
jgi:hypothetical protein